MKNTLVLAILLILGNQLSRAQSAGVNAQVRIFTNVGTHAQHRLPPLPSSRDFTKTVVLNPTTRPYMGLLFRDLTPQLADFFEISGSGALVEATEPAGPAEQAGIKAGDIITALDGLSVTNRENIFARLDAHKPGDALTVALFRKGQSRTVNLTLAARPTQSGTVSMQIEGDTAVGQSAVYGSSETIDVGALMRALRLHMPTPPSLPGPGHAAYTNLQQEINQLRSELQQLRMVVEKLQKP